MEYKYTGIVLSKKDIGEADRLYTFYTLERGKIKAIARGVRKSQAKLAGHLENFCLVDFTVMKNRGMGNIASSIVESNFLNIRNDFDVLRNSFDVIYKFDRLIADEHQDMSVFRLLWVYLAALNESTDRYRLLSQGFLFQLLGLLGYSISTNHCGGCQCAINGGKNYFNYQLGGVVCEECARKMGNSMYISDNSVKLIRIFMKNKLESLVKIKVSDDDIANLELISGNFIKWIL
ncbi:DNA repair protein RecO [Patescibacteria group bacterium]